MRYTTLHYVNKMMQFSFSQYRLKCVTALP